MEYNVKYKVDAIVRALERGMNWRTVVYRTIRELTDLNLMGFELLLKGALMGKGGRKQKYRVPLGYMKKVGNQTNLVKEAKSTAYTKAGAIGVTLKIIPPNIVFPDKISKEDIENAVKKVLAEMSDEEKAEIKQEEIKEKDTKEVKAE